jgi:hypothetical protein
MMMEGSDRTQNKRKTKQRRRRGNKTKGNQETLKGDF